MKIIRIIGLVVLLAASTNASAGLISDFVLDEATNIVTDRKSGIEWLQWDETDGMSISTALSIHSNDGWELASNSQAAYLFNTFDLSYGTFEWEVGEDFERSYRSPTDGNREEVNDRELTLVSLFGNTFEEWEDGYKAPDGMQYTAAFFGLDSDGDGMYKRMWTMDDYGVNQSGKGQAKFDQDIYSTTVRTRTTGVALVRAAPINYNISLASANMVAASSVDEPATFAVLGLALLGLGLRRKARIKGNC